MSSKNFGIQATAYGVLDGTAETGAVLVGEVAGLGAVADLAVGHYTVALDPEVVGLPPDPLDGGYAIYVQANNLGVYASWVFTTPTLLEIRTVDPAGVNTDAIVCIVIYRWPNS